MLIHMEYIKEIFKITLIAISVYYFLKYPITFILDYIIEKVKESDHEDLGDGFSYTVEYDGLVCIIRLFYKGKEFNDRKFKDQDMDFIQNFIIGEVRKYKIGLRGIDSVKRSKELIKQQIKNGIQN